MDPSDRHQEGAGTVEVPDPVFRQVYESPSSLPGAHRWVTPDEDVRAIEKLLGMSPETIGAPLWVSGDAKECPTCQRAISWLDIVSSAVGSIHSARLIAEVMLGERKFVNVEAPNAIGNVRCARCATAIEGIRSFKCHNWAYAVGDLQKVVARVRAPARGRSDATS